MSRAFCALALPLLFLLGSCSSFDKALKSNDVNYKLTKANEYFDKKQYQRANELYATLVPVMRGTRNFEPLYFRYAYSYYNLKDYLSASFHFKNFADQFPTSRDADEAEFLQAVSLYKMAPKASLEQVNTVKAMEALQNYLNSHPKTTRAAEINGYLDAGRKKLEEKEASAAKLYFNMGQHKAAAISYQAVLREYPESPAADYYQYMVVRSLYNYARRSVPEKQEERYGNALAASRELSDLYPTSPYVKEAAPLAALATSGIQQLRK